jgi:hypothetical protein
MIPSGTAAAGRADARRGRASFGSHPRALGRRREAGSREGRTGPRSEAQKGSGFFYSLKDRIYMKSQNTLKADEHNMPDDIFSTRLDPLEIQKIRAYAWHKKVSQRQLIETALAEFWERRDQTEIDQAIKEYKNRDDIQI